MKIDADTPTEPDGIILGDNPVDLPMVALHLLLILRPGQVEMK